MKSIFKNYFVNILLILGFTAFALWFALKDDFNAVISCIQKVDAIPLIFVVVAVFTVHLIVGWIVQQYAKQIKPDYTLKQGFVNALVGAFFHGVTPSATGGQFAQVYTFHKQGISAEKSAGILVVDFIVNEIVVISVSLFMFIMRFSYFSSNTLIYISLAGFILNAAFVILMALCATKPKVYTWITQKGLNIGVKLHIIKNKEKAVDNLNEKLDGFKSGFDELRHNKTLLVKVLFANVVRMVLYFSIPLICALALHIEIPNNDWFTFIALTSFVVNINTFIPIPGASGGTESVFILLFSEIISKSDASSLMLLWRFSTFHIVLLVGALIFVRVQQSKTLSPIKKDEQFSEEEKMIEGKVK